MYVRAFVTLISWLVAIPVSFAETTAAPASWQQALTELGMTLDPEAATRASILAVVQTTDPAARMISAEEKIALQAQQSGQTYAANLRFVMTNGLPVVVESVATNLQAGDIITGIGTNRFTTLARPEARGLFLSDAPGVLELMVERGDETNQVEIVLEPTQLPALDLAEIMAGDIAYITINGLFPESGAEIAGAISELSAKKPAGLVIDLRGAGGADPASVARVASLFSAPGQFLFTLRNLRNEELARFEASASVKINLPVIALIDEQTRGAAEMLAVMLTEVAPSTLLVGATTAGDFNLREPVEVDGYTLHLATRVLDTAGGNRYDGRAGLEPSLTFAAGERETYDYDPPENNGDRRKTLDIERLHQSLRLRVRGDAALERAHDILTALKTLNDGDASVSLPSP